MVATARLLDGPAVRRWLWFVWGTIFAMVVVGGITRLTGSGLSMVEWQPLMGALPPMTEAQWHTVFERYQQFPQYQLVNSWMTLEDFKRIFFWEYLHRLLGRFIGIAVLVPGLWFLVRRRLSRPTALKVLLAFVFGGLQGVLGWYMVKSGLVNVPAVSHYRLAAHLSLAFFVGCWILWILLDIRQRRTGPHDRWLWVFLAVLSLQIVYGAFMAGSRAGYLYSTWPDMNGEHWPTGAELGWPAITSNPLTIHALHRHLAWVVFGFGLVMAWRARHTPAAKALAALLVLQLVLGIATVLMNVQIALATAHQGVAFLLLSATVWLIYTRRA